MSARVLVACLLCLGAGLAIGALVLGGGGTDADLWLPREIDNMAFPISQIVVPVNQERGEAEAEVLIRQAYRLLQGGQDFATVAKNRSEDPSAGNGGFTGFADLSNDKMLQGVVATLRPGAVSPPVHLEKDWRIVKRHSFEEGCRLEREQFIPAHGVFIRWEGMEGGIRGMTRDDARKEAEALTLALKRGETTLTQAMEKYVEERYRRADAFIVMASKADRSADLYEALEDLKPGGFTGPVETRAGWAVLKRGRYLRAFFRQILVQHAFSQGRDLHITRTPEEARAVARKALDEALADRDRWDELVRKYTDDPRQARNHGNMGMLHPGAMPSGFETFIYDTKPGRIHPEVVESTLGFHVLWRLD